MQVVFGACWPQAKNEAGLALPGGSRWEVRHNLPRHSASFENTASVSTRESTMADLRTLPRLQTKTFI
jgi:hypothetical protein